MARERFAACSQALCVHARGQHARQGLYAMQVRASTHVQKTISTRVRGRAVIFVTFDAFAHMLSECVFIAHSGICHELNSLIWVCGM